MSGRPPLVGVTASARGGRTMWLFNRCAVWRAGGSAARLVAGDAVPADRLDALIVGGGDDIDARLYDQDLHLDVRIDSERDALELRYLEAATRRGIPILGVCRGAQMLNVFRGGTLHADIHKVYPKLPRRRTPLPRLRVDIVSGTRLHEILGLERCRVNALHHQSVDRTGEGLKVAATDSDGIVQGLDCESGPLCIGVQWHPEFLVLDRRQQNLFRAVVQAA
jgi:putative glutamine amidotransferase